MRFENAPRKTCEKMCFENALEKNAKTCEKMRKNVKKCVKNAEKM
jgi:hypothetical protein